MHTQLTHNILKFGLALTLITILNSTASAADIAKCGALKGYVNFHHHGLVSKDKSGFSDDTISGAMTSLVRSPAGIYDILLIDAANTIQSFVADGGQISLFRKGASDATFIHFNSAGVIEIYTFWKDQEGGNKYDLMTSKGGDGIPIHLSRVLTGDCDFIDFAAIN